MSGSEHGFPGDGAVDQTDAERGGGGALGRGKGCHKKIFPAREDTFVAEDGVIGVLRDKERIGRLDGDRPVELVQPELLVSSHAGRIGVKLLVGSRVADVLAIAGEQSGASVPCVDQGEPCVFRLRGGLAGQNMRT